MCCQQKNPWNLTICCYKLDDIDEPFIPRDFLNCLVLLVVDALAVELLVLLLKMLLSILEQALRRVILAFLWEPPEDPNTDWDLISNRFLFLSSLELPLAKDVLWALSTSSGCSERRGMEMEAFSFSLSSSSALAFNSFFSSWKHKISEDMIKTACYYCPEWKWSEVTYSEFLS